MRGSSAIRVLIGVALAASSMQPVKLRHLPTVTRVTKKSSRTSKLKMTKNKPNVKYNSSKPVQSKSKMIFRNKSNL